MSAVFTEKHLLSVSVMLLLYSALHVPFTILQQFLSPQIYVK